MARVGLSTADISRALSGRCETRDAFVGVFSLDTLPRRPIERRPAIVVCNTAYSQSRGEHWVGFFFSADGGVNYFDSYGLPPTSPRFLDFIHTNSVNGLWSYNDTQLQSLDSVVCGKYVCLYLYFRVVGYSDTDIKNMFLAGKLVPDVAASKLYAKIFGRVKPGKGCVGALQWSYKYAH